MTLKATKLYESAKYLEDNGYFIDWSKIQYILQRDKVIKKLTTAIIK